MLEPIMTRARAHHINMHQQQRGMHSTPARAADLLAEHPRAQGAYSGTHEWPRSEAKHERDASVIAG
jgi:hypothetical protein